MLVYVVLVVVDSVDIDDDVCAARSVVKDVRCGNEGGCAGQTRKHTLDCTADIWDQLLLGCAGGACGSVDLQLLDWANVANLLCTFSAAVAAASGPVCLRNDLYCVE